jgi:hypothetical protein
MSTPADLFGPLLDELAHRIGAVVAEQLRTPGPGWVDQAGSPLGRNHCRIVRELMARGDRRATVITRRHWITTEALAEEMTRPRNGKAAKTQAHPGKDTPSTIRAELEQELRLVRGGK